MQGPVRWAHETVVGRVGEEVRRFGGNPGKGLVNQTRVSLSFMARRDVGNLLGRGRHVCEQVRT